MKKNILLISSLVTNVVLFAILVVGIAVWPTGTSEIATPVPATQPAIRAVEDRDIVPPVPVRPEPTEQAPNEPESPIAEGPDAFSALLAELEALDMRIVPSRFVERVRVSALNSDARLTDDIRELFALGDHEAERINEILTMTAERLRRLELENLKVDAIAENEALIRIPPLGPEADRLRDELREGILHEMGDLDGPLLWEMIRATGSGDFWSGFGEPGAEMILRLNPNEAGHIGMSLERKPYNEEHPRSTVNLHPFPPEDAQERVELYLKRQVYLIEHLPDHMRDLIRPQSGEPR